MLRSVAAYAVGGALAATTAIVVAAARQEIPRGQVIESIACAAAPAETYALYLPSAYTPERTWPLLMGFHPGARGRAIIDTYRAAAERYGFIVAGSNTSRNGPWEVSARAAQAMSADLGGRFRIDPKRFYLTGHSGGARVAMAVALGTGHIAGVIASSGGYPDAKPRPSVPFVVFGTAGTEDFNYLEMRQLDRALETPHRLAVFEGGHTLPPADVALQAIEWLEIQAIKAGTRARDDVFLDRVWAERQRAIAAAGDTAAAVHLLRAAAEDFDGLRDVSAMRSRTDALAKTRDVSRALARERSDDEEEARTLERFSTLESGLTDVDRRRDSLSDLEGLLSRLSRTATGASDTPARRQARRVLRTITMGAAERTTDQEYLKLLARYRFVSRT